MAFITIKNGKPVVPDEPVVSFIEGDGIGPEIWKATQDTVDAAVSKAYKGKRKILWQEVLAGLKALDKTGDLLPEETLEKIKRSVVSIKGPLTTPVGGGFRSINVTLRQELSLYACIRPVKYYPGVPSPMKEPEKVNAVIFRENMEDIYTGIEWSAGAEGAKKVIGFLNKEMGKKIPESAGIGIKYISREGTFKIMRRAMDHAVSEGIDRVTIVHKGNIMKYTEGAFKDWCYEFVKKEYADKTVFEEELGDGGKIPAGKILVNDRIADNMFQQLLLRPDEYGVICAPNLNGDYLSDALAAQVGGLGMAPGANIGDTAAVFEATHGSAPKRAGQDMANPGSLILSAVMMLHYMGWKEAADILESALSKTIEDKTVTYDLARQTKGAKKVGTKEFASLIARNMKG